MLNPQQTAAVKYTEGPLLVLAGAGSGKTRVITQKIAYLIRECDLHANQILAVTFTNKAANEMRERVAGILSTPKRRGLKVSTFHTFGLSVIKKYAGACGLKKGFTILDQEDTQQVLKDLLPKSRALSQELMWGIQHHISKWKNQLILPDTSFEVETDLPSIKEAYQLYPLYQKALRAYNAVDFDDLINAQLSGNLLPLLD